MQFADGHPIGLTWAPEFNTTHWSVVRAAGRGESPAAEEALEKLCRAYWLPLYAYARRRGYRPEDAQDLTQEFLTELIARRDLAHLDPARGKFRSFLLASLKHFLANDWRERQTLKRGGGKTFLPLDVALVEDSLAADAHSDMPPDRLFDERWAMSVMEQALTGLKAEMVASRKGDLFEELKMFLTTATEAGGYEAAAACLGMSTTAVATAVHRLRQRYRQLIRATLAQTVTSAGELEDEMRYLLEVLT